MPSRQNPLDPHCALAKLRDFFNHFPRMGLWQILKNIHHHIKNLYQPH